jgi:hypothetical protein
MKKIILDLCGGTGSWSKPYKDAGYEVINVTLPEYDVTTYTLPDEPVYGILAAPECTQFSIARTTAKTPRDLRKGMILVEACMNLIWESRKRNKLAFWALENPRGLLRQFLGKPALSFQPDEYGELYTKHTDIWGYFNIPTKLKNKPILNDRVKMQLAKNNRILPDLPEGYKPAYGRNQAARRSMTSPKFAQAFYKANK